MLINYSRLWTATFRDCAILEYSLGLPNAKHTDNHNIVSTTTMMPATSMAKGAITHDISCDKSGRNDLLHTASFLRRGIVRPVTSISVIPCELHEGPPRKIQLNKLTHKIPQRVGGTQQKVRSTAIPASILIAASRDRCLPTMSTEPRRVVLLRGCHPTWQYRETDLLLLQQVDLAHWPSRMAMVLRQCSRP